MDSFRTLAAAADTAASGSVVLIGRAGTYRQGEVGAQTGERWQGLYPTPGGVALRSFALRVETIRHEVLDGHGDPFTGERVTTPFSIPTDGYPTTTRSSSSVGPARRSPSAPWRRRSRARGWFGPGGWSWSSGSGDTCSPSSRGRRRS